MTSWQVYGLLGIGLALIIGIPFVAGRIREVQLNQAGLGHLSQTSYEEMLRHMTHILRTMGYLVEPADERYPEFDLILTDGLGQKRAVLVRHWREVIGEDVIKRLAEGAERLGRSPPLIVTVERYTIGALKAARATEVVLWSLSDLARAIRGIKRSAFAFPDLPGLPQVVMPLPGPDTPLPDPILQPLRTEEKSVAGPAAPMRRRKRPSRMRRGERWSGDEVPFCPRCGRKMVQRKNSENEDFWGCPTFPRCLGTKSKT